MRRLQAFVEKTMCLKRFQALMILDKKNHFYDLAQVRDVNFFQKNIKLGIEFAITCKILKSGQV